MDNFTLTEIVRKRFTSQLVALIIFVVIIGSFLLFFVNNTLLFVSVDGATSGGVSTAIVDGNSIKTVGGSGMVVVPRSTHALVISAGDSSRTLTSLDIPWYGIVSKTVGLNAVSKADKITYKSANPSCAVYSSSLDALLHYDCTKLDALYTNKAAADGTISSEKQHVLSYITGQLLPPYQSGVIGVTSSKTVDPRYTDSQPTTVTATTVSGAASYNAPSDILSGSLEGLKVITDTNSSTNTHFILLDNFGVVYLATLSTADNTVSYKRVAASDDYSARFNQSSCTIVDEAVYCYRSRTSIALDNGAKAAEPTLDILSFSDGLVSSAKVDDAPVADSIYNASGKTYIANKGTLYGLDKSSTSYSAHQLYTGVSSIASGAKLYFVRGGGVYGLDGATGDAKQLFYSKNVSPAGVYPVDGKVFVFGKINTDRTGVYAYLLSSNTSSTGDSL